MMKTSRGFDQCYNGQAAVTDDRVIVGAYYNVHINDKQEFIPTIDSVTTALGQITHAVADIGYFSETNISQCQQRTIKPVISTASEKHNRFLGTVLTPDNSSPTGDSPVDKMNQTLKNEGGHQLYKKSKQTSEPVFGVIKEVVRFRRFCLRGEQQVDGEWSLRCTAYNLKRMFNLIIGMKGGVISPTLIAKKKISCMMQSPENSTT